MKVHVVPVRTYVFVLVSLLALTLATVLVSSLNLGRLNDIAALTIAVVKMVLVVLFFMHLRYSPKLTWLVMASGFLWLGILITLTLGDFATRGWLGVPGK